MLAPRRSVRHLGPASLDTRTITRCHCRLRLRTQHRVSDSTRDATLMLMRRGADGMPATRCWCAAVCGPFAVVSPFCCRCAAIVPPFVTASRCPADAAVVYATVQRRSAGQVCLDPGHACLLPRVGACRSGSVNGGASEVRRTAPERSLTRTGGREP